MNPHIKTPCPSCGETFNDPEARGDHLTDCLASGIEEYAFDTGYSIEEAKQRAEAVIDATLDNYRRVALLWDGGKDATALMHLLSETDPGTMGLVDIIFIDHGQHHPETYEYIEQKNDEWGVDYTRAAHDKLLEQVDTTPPYHDRDGRPLETVPVADLDDAASEALTAAHRDGKPPGDGLERDEQDNLVVPFSMDTVAGEYALYQFPLEQVAADYDAVFTGARKWEGPTDEWPRDDSQIGRRYFEEDTTTAAVTVNPLLDWRETFTYAFLGRPERRVELHPLYAQGVERVRAVPTSITREDEPSQENDPGGTSDPVMDRLEDLGYI